MNDLVRPALVSLTGVLLLTACPGDDATPSEGTGTTGDVASDSTSTPIPDPSTTTGAPATTTDDTTGTADPDSTGPGSSTGPAVCEPDCPDGECCMDGTCGPAPAPTCATRCLDTETCACPEGTDPCDCVGECMPAPVSDCCMPNMTAGCDDMACQDAVCAADAFCCDSEWDQTCTDAVFGLCPGLCPGGPSSEPLYGDCANGGICDASMGQACLGDGTFGWCTIIGCMDDMDCAPAPPTGTTVATCEVYSDGIGGNFNACSLLCDTGQTCPDGMDCFNNYVCVWNPIIPGFENCGIPGLDCPVGATCRSDGAGGLPTWAYCSEGGCTTAADCTYDAPTGDAPVTCGDPEGMGGPNTCYLDCSGGQACPDGMACTDGSFCAWPQGMTLFDDNFETGDFSMGWTVDDVDGQTPNANVAFVTDAWVVGDLDGVGVNFAATSTSWYTPVGQSDDWLISPQVMLGAGSRLFWSARTPDATFPDGYEVRISTAGPVVADFLANPPLFSIAAEDDEYVHYFIDLAAAGYASQPIHVAWRNVTNDGFLLLVDNVAITNVP